MPLRPSAALAIALAGCTSLVSCGRSDGTSGTTLAPLVTVGPTGTEVAASSTAPTTTVFVSDPASPLLTALPQAGCVFADPPGGGEITFVVGDRLFGVQPDGTGARCLVTIAPDMRGEVDWSPDARRAVIGAARLFDAAGHRATGFDPANQRVQWEYPDGLGLLGPTATNNTLVRREAGNVEARTEVTFLAQTLYAVSHPAGQGIVASGSDLRGVSGVFFADPVGDDARPLATTGDGTQIPEVAVDAGGDAVYAIVGSGSTFSVERIALADLTVLEMSSEASPAGRLTVGPAAGNVAWRVGLCNSVTELRVRDTRSGSTRSVDPATPLVGLSLAPVGFLDGVRLVLTARPLGCDGPADLWIWNLLDGSTTLLVKNVEFGSVRLPFPGSSRITISPTAQPAQL